MASHPLQYHSDPALTNSHHFHPLNSFSMSLLSRPEFQHVPSSSQSQRSYIQPSTQSPSRQLTSAASHRSITPSPYTISSLASSCSSHNESIPTSTINQSHAHHTFAMPPSQLAPPPSPFRPTTSPAHPEVQNIIERLTNESPIRPRSRLHSDGEQWEGQGHVQTQEFSLPLHGRSSPHSGTPCRPRTQTFSHGKRRRVGEYI